MIKLGVTRLSRLPKARTWLGRDKHVSLLLLAELARGGDGPEGAAETIMRRVLLPDGTWRESTVGRFRALDPLVLEVLRDRYPRGARLRVLDLAASTGTTSVELYRMLRGHFDLDFVASDRTRDAFALRRPHSPTTVVIDARGAAVQYVLGPFVLPGQGSEARVYPVNRILRRVCAARVAGDLSSLAAALRALDPPDFAEVAVQGYQVTRIPLVAPSCLALLQRQGDFRYEVADILEPLASGAHVIRAMNILHDQYFGEQTMERALRNCLNALEEGGLLILGRSPEDASPAVRATIFTRSAGALRLVRRVGGGSEIEHLILKHAA